MEEKAKGKYTKSEKFFSHLEESKLKMDIINEKYYQDFESSGTIGAGSLSQYRSSIRRFWEHIQKDLITVTVDDINSYLNTFEEGKTKETQQRYIGSFLRFTFNNNPEDAKVKAVTETILWLVDEQTKGLLKILMSK